MRFYLVIVACGALAGCAADEREARDRPPPVDLPTEVSGKFVEVSGNVYAAELISERRRTEGGLIQTLVVSPLRADAELSDNVPAVMVSVFEVDCERQSARVNQQGLHYPTGLPYSAPVPLENGMTNDPGLDLFISQVCDGASEGGLPDFASFPEYLQDVREIAARRDPG